MSVFLLILTVGPLIFQKMEKLKRVYISKRKDKSKYKKRWQTLHFISMHHLASIPNASEHLHVPPEPVVSLSQGFHSLVLAAEPFFLL